MIRGGTGKFNFLVRWYQTGRESSIFWACRETAKFPPLVGHPNLPIREILRRVLGLLKEGFWKESVRVFSFKGKKLKMYKIKDEKEGGNSLMAFNLLKIIHPFQDKKHLRTYWNLNWNPMVGCYFFSKLDRTPSLIPFVKWGGGIQLWLIKTT